MASNKDSSGKITIANVIAVFGLVLLSVLFFLGFLYTGDTLGISVLKGVGLGVIFALLLWFMITAKSKTTLEYKGKWMVSEYTALAIYIILAVVSCSWMTPFINVYAAKNNIKTATQSDLETISTVINEFKSNESTKIRELCNNLILSIESDRQDTSVELLLYKLLDVNSMDDISVSSINQNISDVYTDSIASISEINGWDEEFSSIEKDINSWNILRIPRLIEQVNSLAIDVTEKLNEFTERIPHYDIHDNTTEHIFHAEEQTADTYEADVSTPNKLMGLKNSPWGYGACAVIHMLILFNYLVTRRSNKIRNHKSNNTALHSGIMLNTDNN